MTVETRIYTNHRVSHPGAPFTGSLMLDDAGRGNITLNGPEGPALTFDASRIEPVIAMLQEAAAVRGLMTQTGTDLLVGESAPHADEF